MAATADLAALIDAVTAAGGAVRLVGDTAQLSSPSAGGILHDLVAAHCAVELDTAVRFTDSDEAQATLAVRAGDPAGLAFHVRAGRVHTAPQPAAGGTGEHDALDSALAAWAADRAAGHESLLLGGSNSLVAELNVRARATRLAAADRVAVGPEVPLHDGTSASVGDPVLARRNDRTLRITGTEAVKNGDRFTVTAVRGDGGLRVRHDRSGRQLTLPAVYVADHVQLGYAATIHVAQGATVDTTHTVLTGGETREQLYVALTRGRHANHLHLAPTAVDGAGSGDRAHPALTPAASRHDDPAHVLEQILARSDTRPSATSALAEAGDPARRLHAAVQRYLDATRLSGAAGPAADRRPATGGPLPWLPPPPDPRPTAGDPGRLAEYLQQRADIVHTLAAAITADDLPDTTWAHQLRGLDPDLAREIAVWRVAAGITDRQQPLGPATSSTPDMRERLRRRIEPHLLTGPVTRYLPSTRLEEDPSPCALEPAGGPADDALIPDGAIDDAINGVHRDVERTHVPVPIRRPATAVHGTGARRMPR